MTFAVLNQEAYLLHQAWAQRSGHFAVVPEGLKSSQVSVLDHVLAEPILPAGS